MRLFEHKIYQYKSDPITTKSNYQLSQKYIVFVKFILDFIKGIRIFRLIEHNFLNNCCMNFASDIFIS